MEKLEKCSCGRIFVIGTQCLCGMTEEKYNLSFNIGRLQGLKDMIGLFSKDVVLKKITEIIESLENLDYSSCLYKDACKEEFHENCDSFDDCMQNYAESRGP